MPHHFIKVCVTSLVVTLLKFVPYCLVSYKRAMHGKLVIINIPESRDSDLLGLLRGVFFFFQKGINSVVEWGGKKNLFDENSFLGKYFFTLYFLVFDKISRKYKSIQFT